jgi:hypothetical protein
MEKMAFIDYLRKYTIHLGDKSKSINFKKIIRTEKPVKKESLKLTRQ